MNQRAKITSKQPFMKGDLNSEFVIREIALE